MSARLSLFLVAVVSFVLAACSSDAPPIQAGPVGPRKFAEACTATEQCASALCIRADSEGGFCSRPCVTDTECPTSPSWKCIATSSGNVCACRRTSSEEVCGNGIDDNCDGKTDDCMMCNGKPVARDDHENCGRCGNACRTDQRCSDGACGCITGETECGGACVDTKSSTAHCGKCGNSCGKDQLCRDGSCACPSSDAPDSCVSGCVDLKTDSGNCGTCGTVCGTGLSCRSGKCECTDAATPDACSGVCTNVSTDRNNCGSCGNACKPALACISGTCGCSGGATVCGDACVNTATDVRNCGACGTSCRSDQTCLGGTCSCRLGVECGGACKLISSDPMNCGACGNTCAPGEVCSSGSCTCSSAVKCGGACMPMNDPLNCGSCGNACSSAQYCTGGACRCSASGLTPCGSACVNTSTSTTNCGGCGITCKSTEICAAGVCACPFGTTWCAAAGACINLTSDAANCGACGNACGPTQVCWGSSCTCPISGQRFCATASSCVDVASNDLHCGACDRACPGGTKCTSGACTCTTPGLSLCGTSCVDFKADKTNCGACGNVCPGTMMCSVGKCQCEAPIAGAPFRLTNAPLSSRRPTLTWNGTHVGLAWIDYRDTIGVNTANVFFVLLNPDGTRASTDLKLTNFPGESILSAAPTAYDDISVIWTGTQWTVTHSELIRVGTELKSQLHLHGITPTGALGSMDVVVTPTGVGTDTRMLNTSVAWSPTEGYAAAYLSGNQYSMSFRRLGPTATAPDAPIAVTITDPDSFPLSKTSTVVSPSGEWAVLTERKYNSFLVRFNADGSRTKPVVTLDNSTRTSNLVADGPSGFAGVFVRQEYFAGKTTYHLTLARGNDFASRFALESQEASIMPFTAPYLVPHGNTLELLGTIYESGSSGRVTLKRWTFPSTITTAPTVLAERVNLMSTPNHFVGYGFGAALTGTSLLTAWTDDRWGYDFELYGAVVDLRACP